MAIKKKKKINPVKRKILLTALLIIAVFILSLFAHAALNANTLHVMRAEVYLEDLPAAFEQKTILYISDIDLCGINTAKKSAAALQRLQNLNPDMLILGGDYTSSSLFELLNRTADSGDTSSQMQARTDFFHYISAFNAPLGKFAIASPEDPNTSDLESMMVECGIQPVSDRTIPVSIGNSKIWLAGSGASDGSFSHMNQPVSRSDCLICVSYSPASFPLLMTLEASDGGHIVDLALAGHTHGGQIRLFGRNVLSLSLQERQYLYGWSHEANVPMLTTSGLGCEGANLRLGTQSEVWLLTLTGQREDTPLNLN